MLVRFNDSKQGSCYLKTRLNFLNTLPPVFLKDNFPPIDFMIYALEDRFMQLLVEESL